MNQLTGVFNSKLSFVDRSAIDRSIAIDPSTDPSMATPHFFQKIGRVDAIFCGPKIVKIGAILAIFRPFENVSRLDF